MMSSCGTNAPQDLASDAELAAVLREFGGQEQFAPGDAARIRAVLKQYRFDVKVDPEVQPQGDFDAEVD